MKAKIISIQKKQITTKEGKKFDQIEIKADVIVNDKGEVKTYTNSMSYDHALKYFKFAARRTEDVIGEDVEVVLARRQYTSKEGQSKTYTFIKFLNFLDNENKPIIMPRSNQDKIEF